MAVDKRLLDMLRCPLTRQGLSPLGAQELARLNERIRSGEVTDVGGSAVDEPLVEALVTDDGALVYRIDHRTDHDVPSMVGERAIRREPATES